MWFDLEHAPLRAQSHQTDQIDQTDQTDQIDAIDEIDQIDQMKLTRFEDLECWQEARHLVRKVYAATKSNHMTSGHCFVCQSSVVRFSNGAFKKDLRLSGQIQAAAASAMANIAEGFIRHSDKEFTQFLFIAMSSAAEVQSHLYIAVDQQYVDQRQFQELYDQANKTAMIISGLIKYLRTKPTK